MPVPQTSVARESSAKSEDLASLIRESEETSTGASLALPIRPNWKFFLRHWPSEWAVAELGFEKGVAWWLPTLSKHVVRPGTNMNRTLKKDEEPRAAYDHQVLADSRAGATYLELKDWRTRLVDGRPYRSEAPCRDPKTRREGVFFLESFATPRDRLPGKPLKFDFDRPAYNRWRLQLVQLGVIDSPPKSLVRAKIAEKAAELDRVRSFTGLSDAEKKRRVNEAELVVRLWENAKIPGLEPELIAERSGRPAAPRLE